MTLTNKQLCMRSERDCEIIPKKSEDLQEPLDYCSNSDNKYYIKPIMKSVKSEFSIRNRHSEDTSLITGQIDKLTMIINIDEYLVSFKVNYGSLD